MKFLRLFLLCVLVASCSSDSPEPEPEGNPNPPNENPDNPDGETPPEPEEFLYPYEVTVINFDRGAETEQQFDRNGEFVQTVDINSELQLGPDGFTGNFSLFPPEYSFARTRTPGRISFRNTATDVNEVIQPYCSSESFDAGAAFSSSAQFTGHLFFGGMGNARIDVFSRQENSCTTLEFPEYNQFYRFRINENVMIVDNGQLPFIFPDGERLLYFVDLNTLETYDTLAVSDDFDALAINGDELYLIYVITNTEVEYEVRNLATLEILTPRTPTSFFPPNGPFLSGQWNQDTFYYDVPGAGPGPFALLPGKFDFSDDTFEVADLGALLTAFQDDYFEQNGNIPLGFSFTTSQFDPVSEDLVLGFQLTEDPCGCQNFTGGILFTNFDAAEYLAYYIDPVPGAILVDFSGN
ncbi:hypothetical protein SAMN04490243_1043 [Robiginitalea myxolifaciens]|uniref:Uncharacterized protein n=1 Tax=Robiginitalea myxolifaciens TaxID=400055 RepID=A0A1I6G0N2_9FLAO|nr:hypothetical protein [Robiginitalea myxolifaciens]SFR35773.1 hypothetical protein SAMN04490243_1043 [Robiginitalea myxolifaciens]